METSFFIFAGDIKNLPLVGKSCTSYANKLIASSPELLPCKSYASFKFIACLDNEVLVVRIFSFTPKPCKVYWEAKRLNSLITEVPII